MSFAVVNSRALCGMNTPLVEVEVHLANGLPQFNIVGLPDIKVRGSRDRVHAVIIQSGFDFPAKKITVNLVPADLPKESGRSDLPIAIGALAASGQIDATDLAKYESAGELALSGVLRSVREGLAMAWQAQQACRRFVLPSESAVQVVIMKNIKVYGAGSLREAVAYLSNVIRLSQTVAVAQPQTDEATLPLPDLKDVKGQHTARLALEIAAAGGHSLLMIGPPGTGKSMLAQRLPSILSPLTNEELISVWALHSFLPQHSQKTDNSRPHKTPHHSASVVALVGEGSDPRPGETSLAHRGILFLDELPEFNCKVLEALREPMESGEIHISRAAGQAVLPAEFQLVAAMNPCPCGFYGHPVKPCRCTPDSTQHHRNKISDPLLDRLDLVIEVPTLPVADLVQAQAGESSAEVLKRVVRARERQYVRQGKLNSGLSPTKLDNIAAIPKEARETLAAMLEELSLSARNFHHILRAARTIADLKGGGEVLRAYVLKAVGFRRATWGCISQDEEIEPIAIQ